MIAAHMPQPCAACGALRPLRDLLVVSEMGGLHRARYVCRPSVSAACFGSVRSRAVERVELADPREQTRAFVARVSAHRLNEDGRMATPPGHIPSEAMPSVSRRARFLSAGSPIESVPGRGGDDA